jgi:hypothetical protein
MSPIAFVTDQVAIGRILDHLGLSTPEAEKPPPPVPQILRVAEHGDGWGVPAQWESAAHRRATQGLVPDRFAPGRSTARRVPPGKPPLEARETTGRRSGVGPRPSVASRAGERFACSEPLTQCALGQRRRAHRSNRLSVRVWNAEVMVSPSVLRNGGRRIRGAACVALRRRLRARCSCRLHSLILLVS